MRFVMPWLLVLSLFAACDDPREPKPGTPGSTERVGRLGLRDGQSLQTAAECGIDLPACGTALTCASFTYEGAVNVRCIDTATACDLLFECSGGTVCVVLESYPVQLSCSGTCTGDDCDTVVANR